MTAAAQTPADCAEVAEGGPRRRLDAVSVLTAYLFLVLAVPSQLVLPGLGGIGSPATVLGLGCLMWWCWDRVHRSSTMGSSPVLGSALVLAGAVTASYIAALSRPTSPEEFSVASLGVVSVASWCGVLLIAHDGVRDRARCEVLVRRLVVGGVLLALLGLIQFVTGRAWVDLISIPGLHEIRTIAAAQTRSGFTRPAGTATHPIEFGAVLCMLLPFALSRATELGARCEPARAGLLAAAKRWIPPLLIGVALVLSGSRSALVGLAVGVLCLLPSLAVAQRLGVLAGAGCVAVGVFLLVPGMSGSLLGLFTGISEDPGVSSRVDGYVIAWDYFERSPAFGRGFATFLPRYRIFDNQYLLSLVEIGAVGVSAILVLAGTAVWCATQARRRGTDAFVRSAAGAARASVITGAVSLSLFDGFSFPTMPAIWFITIAMCGAQYRLVRQSVAVAPVSSQ